MLLVIMAQPLPRRRTTSCPRRNQAAAASLAETLSTQDIQVNRAVWLRLLGRTAKPGFETTGTSQPRPNLVHFSVLLAQRTSCDRTQH